MFQPADDNIHFEVRVKGELGVTTDGKEDYYDKFVEFKQSFIDREIIPIHVFSPKSDFTLYGDGYVQPSYMYVLRFHKHF